MTFWKYITAAFNARPFGIFIPLNWIALGAFALLGYVEPGFLFVGAGLELAYLFGLASSTRFQALVDGDALATARQTSQEKIAAIIGSLSTEYAQKYTAIKDRCSIIIRQGGDGDVSAISQGLDRLLWIYLKLLTTACQLEAVRDIPRTRGVDSLTKRCQEIAQQVKALSDDQVDQRSSLEQTLETLQARIKVQQEAADKLGFCKTELQRIEEEVELVRDQAMVATEPVAVTRQVSAITSGLASTNNWIKEQQGIFGSLTDELSEPGPILSTQQ